MPLIRAEAGRSLGVRGQPGLQKESQNNSNNKRETSQIASPLSRIWCAPKTTSTGTKPVWESLSSQTQNRDPVGINVIDSRMLQNWESNLLTCVWDVSPCLAFERKLRSVFQPTSASLCSLTAKLHTSSGTPLTTSGLPLKEALLRMHSCSNGRHIFFWDTRNR